MAARKGRASSNASSSLFALAQRQIVALYDAGVLSPAVLHHVIAAYASSDIDWSEAGTLRTVDDHSMQEAVVLIGMPGRSLRSAQKDFMSIVEHLSGAKKAPVSSEQDDDENENEDDEALLSQLGGGKSSKRAAKKSPQKPAQKRAGFNPLVGARAVKKG